MSVDRLTKRTSEGHGYIPCHWKESAEAVDKGQERLAAIEDILGDDYDLSRIRELVQADRDGRWDTQFSGSFFSNRRMLDSLVVILCVSVLLMYFILAAQFESFLQPLIVLLEIPVDLAFALVLLWACGHTLNLMSAIGLIVTCGVIINDSILKLDAINELRRAGWALLPAIHEAGRRRLRPIVMTALTSVCGMVPLLFASDMGSELQHPFVIGMMGAMLVGTLVSLFLIPLAYWFVYRRADAGRDLICKE